MEIFAASTNNGLDLLRYLGINNVLKNTKQFTPMMHQATLILITLSFAYHAIAGCSCAHHATHEICSGEQELGEQKIAHDDDFAHERCQETDLADHSHAGENQAALPNHAPSDESHHEHGPSCKCHCKFMVSSRTNNYELDLSRHVLFTWDELKAISSTLDVDAAFLTAHSLEEMCCSPPAPVCLLKQSWLL